jgi:hypothetical protein
MRYPDSIYKYFIARESCLK